MTCFSRDANVIAARENHKGRCIFRSFGLITFLGMGLLGVGGSRLAVAQKLPSPKKLVALAPVKASPLVKKPVVPVVASHKQARHGRRRVYRGRRYMAKRRSIPTVIAVYDKKGNYVEPLSNRLVFAMPSPAVRTQFGKPEKTIGSQLRYANFGVEYLKGSSKMNFVALQGDVKLNSKLGAGSTRSEVEKVFGKLDPQGDVIYKKYKLHFSHSPGGIIDAVTVAPLPGSETL